MPEPIIVSADTPPPSGGPWERGTDPFHSSAFSGVPIKGIQEMMAAVNPGPIKGGWYLLDWCGQEIGFVRDGTAICGLCKGVGEEFPGAPVPTKCEECNGTGFAETPR